MALTNTQYDTIIREYNKKQLQNRRDQEARIALAEKELPDAFLRRCVFHYIEFPDQEQMEQILRVHFGDLDGRLIAQALAAFYWVRSLREVEKKPSTSELVDWLRALVAGGVDPERLEKEIPFAGVLLKKDKDLRALQRARR